MPGRSSRAGRAAPRRGAHRRLHRDGGEKPCQCFLFATAQGGERLADRFIDATPLLRHDAEAGSREQDCRAWLAVNRHSGPWLALDDMPSLFETDSAHLSPVNAKRGLMHYDVERISALIVRALR